MDISRRIVHISDTHISRIGPFYLPTFQKAIQVIQKLSPQPDVIIHSGDITDNGVLSDYEYAAELLSNLKGPTIYAPGNHDERNYGHSLFKDFFGPSDQEKRFGDLLIVALNSPQPDRDDGRLGRRRQQYLESLLQRTTKDMFRVIVFHHHLIPVPHSGRESNVLEDAGDVLDIVIKGQVNLVLMGHRHVRRAIRIEGTVLSNAGTVSSWRTRGRFGHSFNIIDLLSDGALKITEYKLDEDAEVVLAHYPPRLET